jgi:RNA 2',3'-cyclic 3'-phosphodiesterase
MAKRLFIGIKIKPSDKLLELYQGIKQDLINERIKWIENENMHITLKFLGDTEVNLIPKIDELLKNAVANYKPFKFNIKGLGNFKKNKQIKVIWMGLDQKSELDSIANFLIDSFEKCGFENEQRDFNAHLTLGRVNSMSNNNKFDESLRNYQNSIVQSVFVNEIILFESVLKPSGRKYMEIERYALQNV